MKWTITLCCYFFIVAGSAFAQAPIAWQKCFGGTNMELAAEIELTMDGGYILAGSTISLDGDVTAGKGDYDVWIVKVDDTGKIEWQNTYGGSGKDIAASIKATSDGGYIVAATTESVNGEVSGNHGEKDIWVMKLDAAGSIQWKNCYGGSDDDEAAAIHTTGDGGYIFLGKTFSSSGDITFNRGAGDIWVVKLDQLGTIEWQKSLGGTGAEKAAQVDVRADGGYIIAGGTFSNNWDVSGNHGDFDYWIVALSGTGVIQWQKALGGSGTDEATDISVTADSGYIVAGYSSSKDGQVKGNHGLHDYWIVKLDKAGTLQWQTSAGGSQTDIPNSIIPLSDGNFVTVGTTYSVNGDVYGNKGNYDYWVAELNASGVLERQLCLGGTSAETAMSVKETSDGKLVLVGESYSTNGDVTALHGSSDIWMVQLQSVPLNVSDVSGQELLTYPEPVKDRLYFTNSMERVSIYSFDGKRMMEAFYTNEIDTRQLPAGIYFIKALDKNKKLSCKKFIKE